MTTAIKQTRKQRPKDWASDRYKSIYSHNARKSPILSMTERAWSMHYCSIDFNSTESLAPILAECKARLKFKQSKLDDVLKEITNIINRQILTGKDVELPDPDNLYKWRGIRSDRLDEALAVRDVVKDELSQIQRDMQKIKDNQKKAVEVKRKTQPNRLDGSVQLKNGIPSKIDGMSVVLTDDDVPTIGPDEYYSGMTLPHYMRDVVKPWKKDQADRAKAKDRKISEAIENGHCMAL